MKLIIVESPTKADTIQRFVKKREYIIRSSYGHIRDLPQKELAIDVENDFQPKYVISYKARKVIRDLKNYLPQVDSVVLATDEDREGEAIAWHLTKALKLGGFQSKSGKKQATATPYQRIVFHEITEKAIDEAFQSPREIDTNLVNAQQARRVLDRLVGYKLSPFLWKKVMKGLSAGRVQSVAVRLICEREEEIEKFNPQEYWSLEADFRPGGSKTKFKSYLWKKDDKTLGKLAIKDKTQAEDIKKDLSNAEYKISKIEKKEKSQAPLPPFTTSLLQQEAGRRIYFPVKMTMRVAQGLYEKGYITYHRTDSFNLSQDSLAQTSEFIKNNYGKKYFPGYSRKYKTKSQSAQEAHEAIRPTDVKKHPSALADKLKSEEKKLYDLIWRRFVASQMSNALFDSTLLEIRACNTKSGKLYTFKSTGQVIKFDGFLKVYPLSIKENILPELSKGEVLDLLKLEAFQHFTKPPARYTEATLVKVLEKYGIGRPSTYAPIISTVQERNYVEKDEKKRLKPTEIGVAVNSILVKHFPRIVGLKFTAKMEKELDKIAKGELEWKSPIRDFYFPFERRLKNKEKEVEKVDLTEPTEEECPNCGRNLVIKRGKYGKFYACPGFPKCKFSKPYQEVFGTCPQCGKGEVVKKRSKKGRIFYACSQYPECKYTSNKKPEQNKTEK